MAKDTVTVSGRVRESVNEEIEEMAEEREMSKSRLVREIINDAIEEQADDEDTGASAEPSGDGSQRAAQAYSYIGDAGLYLGIITIVLWWAVTSSVLAMSVLNQGIVLLLFGASTVAVGYGNWGLIRLWMQRADPQVRRFSSVRIVLHFLPEDAEAT